MLSASAPTPETSATAAPAPPATLISVTTSEWPVPEARGRRRAQPPADVLQWFAFAVAHGARFVELRATDDQEPSAALDDRLLDLLWVVRHAAEQHGLVLVLDVPGARDPGTIADFLDVVNSPCVGWTVRLDDAHESFTEDLLDTLDYRARVIRIDQPATEKKGLPEFGRRVLMPHRHGVIVLGSPALLNDTDWIRASP